MNYANYKSAFELLNQWLMNVEQGIKPEQYFTDRNYKRVAIYGMGELGVHLYHALSDSPVKVSYVIDRKGTCMVPEVTVKRPEDELEMVDVIVVTVLGQTEKLISNLKEKVKAEVVSIETVIWES